MVLCRAGELEEGIKWAIMARCGFQRVLPVDTRADVEIEADLERGRVVFKWKDESWNITFAPDSGPPLIWVSFLQQHRTGGMTTPQNVLSQDTPAPDTETSAPPDAFNDEGNREVGTSGSLPSNNEGMKKRKQRKKKK